MEEFPGLQIKEPAEGVEGVGVEPAELATDAGEPVRRWIAERGALAEGVGGDVASLHDLVDPEPYHREAFELEDADWGIQRGECPTAQDIGGVGQ